MCILIHKCEPKAIDVYLRSTSVHLRSTNVYSDPPMSIQILQRKLGFINVYSDLQMCTQRAKSAEANPGLTLYANLSICTLRSTINVQQIHPCMQIDKDVDHYVTVNLSMHPFFLCIDLFLNLLVYFLYSSSCSYTDNDVLVVGQ